ncbi:MAG: hypothetical protein AAGA78_15250 [Pseudomonadota bacterium]
MIWEDINVVLPEVILAVYAMAALMFGTYARNHDAASRTVLWASAAVLLLMGLWVGLSPEGARTFRRQPNPQPH